MASNNDSIARFTEQCKLSWLHLRLLYQNYHSAYLLLCKSLDEAISDLKVGWAKYRGAQPDPGNADYGAFLAFSGGARLRDRVTRIDGAGRQHTDRMNIMAEVYGQKNDELTSEERWEKLVAEAEEKFEGRGL